MAPSKTITVRLSDELYLAIIRRAKKKRIDISKAVRQALAEWADNPDLAHLPNRGRPKQGKRR